MTQEGFDFSQEFNFNLSLKGVPVKLQNENGETVEYQLKEFNSQQREIFLTNMRGRMSGTGKEATITNFEGMHASLLTKCLYAPDGKLVTAETLNKWPASVVSELFKAGQAINGLDKAAVDSAKNDLEAKKESGSNSPTDSESPFKD